MPFTQWGAKITFGWEYENQNLKILEWYRPERMPMRPWSTYDNDRFNKAWSELTSVNKEARYKQLKQQNFTWDDYIKLPTAPDFLADRLKQEMWEKTYEILNKAGSYPDSVDSLFSQLDQVDRLQQSGQVQRYSRSSVF
jgi:hypothetical protein